LGIQDEYCPPSTGTALPIPRWLLLATAAGVLFALAALVGGLHVAVAGVTTSLAASFIGGGGECSSYGSSTLQRLPRLARRLAVLLLDDRDPPDDLERLELDATLHATRLEQPVAVGRLRPAGAGLAPEAGDDADLLPARDLPFHEAAFLATDLELAADHA